MELRKDSGTEKVDPFLTYFPIITHILATPHYKDKLIDPTTVSHIWQITPTIGAVVVGLMADARGQIQKARSEAAEYRYTHGIEVTPEARECTLPSCISCRSYIPFGVFTPSSTHCIPRKLHQSEHN